jgi:hypothetical protein
MKDRPVSLWTYKNGDSTSDLFHDIDMAIGMIIQQCNVDITLLVIKKDGLDGIPHSVLGRKINSEVKVPHVNNTNIIGIHDIDYYNPNHRKSTDGVTSFFSSKRFLNRTYKKYKYKKWSVDFQDFLQKFYFHFTCNGRIQSIKLHGLVSSSEPTIDIFGGRCAIRRKKITYRKRRKTLKNTQKKKQSKTKSKSKTKSRI